MSFQCGLYKSCQGIVSSWLFQPNGIVSIKIVSKQFFRQLKLFYIAFFALKAYQDSRIQFLIDRGSPITENLTYSPTPSWKHPNNSPVVKRVCGVVRLASTRKLLYYLWKHPSIHTSVDKTQHPQSNTQNSWTKRGWNYGIVPESLSWRLTRLGPHGFR